MLCREIIAVCSENHTDHLSTEMISPQPDQEGNNLTFLLDWREFPSAPCLAEKKT